MPEPLSQAGPRSRRHLLRRLLPWLLLAVALAFMVRAAAGVGWADLARLLAGASRPLSGAAALLLLARFAVWSCRWSLAVRRLGGTLSQLHGFFLILAAAALNHITPTLRLLGGLLRARHLSRSGDRSFAAHYGGVLYDQVAHNLMMAAATWLSFVALAAILQRWILALAALLLPGATLAALALWRRSAGPELGAVLERWATGRGGRLRAAAAGGRELQQTFRHLVSDRPLRLHAAALGAAFFLLNVLAQWLLFAAVGGEAGFLQVAAGVALGHTAGIVTGTPGGVATTEAAMIATYVALGIPRLDAVAATLLFRGLHYGVILLLGIPSLLILEWRARGAAADHPLARRPDRPR